jgi:hypothetical protein
MKLDIVSSAVQKCLKPPNCARLVENPRCDLLNTFIYI